ncbi:MAG: bacillithiol system redox-active protein YtxJ [Gemmatimonadales bacterium]|jgi:bacillithiol system protein YtxJ
MGEIQRLDREEDLEVVLAAELALVYKHSPRCVQALFARSQVDRFAETSSDISLYMIDVIVDREVSNAVARRVGVPHESPQVILLRRGRPIWHASHGGVKAKAIAAALSRSD